MACAGRTDGWGCSDNCVLHLNCSPTTGVKPTPAYRENPFANSSANTVSQRVWGTLSCTALLPAVSPISNQHRVWHLLLSGCKVLESSHFWYLSCPLAIAKLSSNHHQGTDFYYHITSEKHTRMYRPLEHNTLRLGRGTVVICERSFCSAQGIMKLNTRFHCEPTGVNPSIPLSAEEEDFSHVILQKSLNRRQPPKPTTTVPNIWAQELSEQISQWKGIVLSFCKGELRQKVDK